MRERHVENGKDLGASHLLNITKEFWDPVVL